MSDPGWECITPPFIIIRKIPNERILAMHKKRKSPLTPYREKQYRVSCETSIKPARAYARAKLRCTCSYEEAGAAADEIVGSCFGTMRDHALKKVKDFFHADK